MRRPRSRRAGFLPQSHTGISPACRYDGAAARPPGSPLSLFRRSTSDLAAKPAGRTAQSCRYGALRTSESLCAGEVRKVREPAGLRGKRSFRGWADCVTSSTGSGGDERAGSNIAGTRTRDAPSTASCPRIVSSAFGVPTSECERTPRAFRPQRNARVSAGRISPSSAPRTASAALQTHPVWALFSRSTGFVPRHRAGRSPTGRSNSGRSHNLQGRSCLLSVRTLS